MKVYFFCGVIILKIVKDKNNYQIDKIYFPDKIGMNGKELMTMLNYYARQKEMVSNLSLSNNSSYYIDIFRNEDDLINILLNYGYSKSHCIDIIRKGYRTLSKVVKFGI